MDLVELLEYPNSKLKVSIEKLNISTSSISQGEFIIKNEAIGILKGNIRTKNSIIKFIPNNFEANNIKICYFVDVTNYKIQKSINFDVIISSNGGEVIVPVMINITPPVIDTELDMKIYKLSDFLIFAKNHPKEAQALFYKNEFVSWLINIQYEYLPIYDYIVKDRNKERSLENFFILNKLKDEVNLKASSNKLYLDIKNDSKEIIKGKILITKTCWGYFEYPVIIKNNSSWITFKTDILTSRNFTDDDTFLLEYFIDTSIIDNNIVLDKILIGKDIEIDVRIRRKKIAYINLSKENFSLEDKGYIKVENFTSKDIKIELSSKNSFIKFDLTSYYISSIKTIPFTIKFNAFQRAHNSIKKQQLIEAKIFIKIISNSSIYYKTLYITVGDVLQ